jgi:hypothetical protein
VRLRTRPLRVPRRALRPNPIPDARALALAHQQRYSKKHNKVAKKE